MSGKSLNISIDGGVLPILKNSNYNLCLAKGVSGYPFTIVWYASADYLACNKFSWTPTYEMFFIPEFVLGAQIGGSSTAVSILPGEQVTVDVNGVLSTAEPGDNSTALTMINNYPKPMYPGLKQSATDFDSKTVIAPNFVTDEAVVMGVTELTPVELIMVWFETRLETGTMIDRPLPDGGGPMVSRTNPFVVDCAQSDDVTIVFDANQHWSVSA